MSARRLLVRRVAAQPGDVAGTAGQIRQLPLPDVPATFGAVIGRHDNRGALRLRAVPNGGALPPRRRLTPALALALVVHGIVVAGLLAWRLPVVYAAVRQGPISATITFAGLREPSGGAPAAGGGGGAAAPLLTRLEPPKPKLEMPPLPCPQPQLAPVFAVEAPEPVFYARYQPASFRGGDGTGTGDESGNGVGIGSGSGEWQGGVGRGTGDGIGNGEGGGFGDANYLRCPQPRYPSAARRQGWEGTTVLRVQIQTDGLPGTIEIVQSAGYRELDDAAVQAVRAAQFVPAHRDGVQIVSWVEVPVTFRLNRG